MVCLRTQPLHMELDETGKRVFGWQVRMMTESLCGGIVHPYPLLRTFTVRLASSAILVYRAPQNSEGFYVGKELSQPLIEVEGEVWPNDCQMPMNHINRVTRQR